MSVSALSLVHLREYLVPRSGTFSTLSAEARRSTLDANSDSYADNVRFGVQRSRAGSAGRVAYLNISPECVGRGGKVSHQLSRRQFLLAAAAAGTAAALPDALRLRARAAAASTTTDKLYFLSR